jgi:hypothetical protein
MHLKFILLCFLSVSCTVKSEDSGCVNDWGSNCGKDCGGMPHCGENKQCGNVAGMCWCDCNNAERKCITTDLGYTWNDGILDADGQYALNGTKGDGKGYKC